MPTLPVVQPGDIATDRTACQGCPADGKCHEQLVKTAPSSHRRPKLLVVTDSPTWEDEDGEYLGSGTAGEILKRLVESSTGLDADRDVAYSAVVRCNIRDRKIRADAVRKHCVHNLINDIHELQPEQVVYVGERGYVRGWLSHNYHRGRRNTLSLNTDRTDLPDTLRTEGVKIPVITTKGVKSIMHGKALAPVASIIARDLSKLRDNTTPQTSGALGTVTVVDTVEKLQEMIAASYRLTDRDCIAFDWETGSDTVYGLARVNPHAVCLAVAWGDDHAYVIPWGHRESLWVGDEWGQVKELLRQWFMTKGPWRAWLAHNAKFDYNVCTEVLGTREFANPVICTAMTEHQLDENRLRAGGILKQESQAEFGTKRKGAYNLKTLVEERLDFWHYDKEVLKAIKDGQAYKLPMADLAAYAGMDVYVLIRLFRDQETRAYDQGMYEQWIRFATVMTGAASYTISRVERNGLPISRQRLMELLDPETSPIVTRIAALEAAFKEDRDIAWTNLQIGKRAKKHPRRDPNTGRLLVPWLFQVKDTHLRILLFERLGLTPIGYTEKKREPQVNKDLYKAYKDTHEIVAKIAEYSELQTLLSSYLKSWLNLLNSMWDCLQTGRLHPSFGLYQTLTGRLNSNKPNGQNIPSGKTPSATLIKSLVEADWENGYIVVAVDFSQAEVRWLAQTANDLDMARAFRNARDVWDEFRRNPTPELRKRVILECDVHRQNAALMFGVAVADVTPEQRKAIKSIVFGIIYGQGIKALARAIGRDPDDTDQLDETRALQKQFMAQFGAAAFWLTNIQEIGKKNGRVVSDLGRARRFFAHLLEGLTLPGIDKEDEDTYKKIQSYEDRVTRNAPIQGEASDTNLYATIELQRYIDEYELDWQILALVHDSILSRIPLSDLRHYARVVRKIMTNPELMADFGVHLDVPMDIDIEAGLSWGHSYQVLLDTEDRGFMVEYKTRRGKKGAQWFETEDELVGYVNRKGHQWSTGHIAAVEQMLLNDMASRRRQRACA